MTVHVVRDYLYAVPSGTALDNYGNRVSMGPSVGEAAMVPVFPGLTAQAFADLIAEQWLTEWIYIAEDAWLWQSDPDDHGKTFDPGEPELIVTLWVGEEEYRASQEGANVSSVAVGKARYSPS